MYIRTLEEALDTLSEILELPERRDQILRSTVAIMLCLNSETRTFVADAQALLIQGGLETLRKKRRDLLEHLDAPIAVLDPEEDKAFDEITSAVDALRLSEVAFQVLPELARSQARWQIARALLGREAEFEEALAQAIRARGNEAERERVRLAIHSMIQGCEPGWSQRQGAIRSACRDVLRGGEQVSAERLEGETDTLFALFATADHRALPLLQAIDRDPGEAIGLISRTYAHLNTARALLSEINAQ